MHVGRSGQYAIRALLDLAENGGGTVHGIAERTGVPAPFLQQLVAPLKESGLVGAKRGPGGGLVVAKPLEAVTLLSVLEAVGNQGEEGESEWLNMFPEKHRRRLSEIERLLPSELGMLTLADLVPMRKPEGSGDVGDSPESILPRRLLDLIGHQAVAATHADRCALYFGGEGYGYVTTAIEMRENVSLFLPDSPTPLNQSWVPHKPAGAMAVAWLTGRRVVIDDALTDPRASREIVDRFNIRSVAAIPIHAGKDGSGVLVVSKQEPNAWDPVEIDRATDLATISGLAIIGHNHLAGTQSSSPVERC